MFILSIYLSIYTINFKKNCAQIDAKSSGKFEIDSAIDLVTLHSTPYNTYYKFIRCSTNEKHNFRVKSQPFQFMGNSRTYTAPNGEVQSRSQFVLNIFWGRN